MNLDAWKILMADLTPDGIDCHSYSPALGNGSTVEFETSLLLYSLVRRFQPNIICDTGTHYGVATACMALGLRDNWLDYKPRGFICTVDSGDYPQNEPLWEKLGVREFVRKTVSDSLVAPVPNDIDMLFLDSDHETSHIIAEWNHFAPSLNRKRALVLNHDTRLDPRSGDAMREILAARLSPILEYRLVSHVPLRNMRGLDLLFLSNEEY